MSESSSTPVICFGEILWDMLPDGPQPGGAPLNVAYHLKKQGIATSIVSRIGNDLKGRELQSLLDTWGINQHLLQHDEQYGTGKVVAKMTNENEVSYDILFPAAWDFITSTKNLSSNVNEAQYFIYGSLASRNEITRDTLFELLETKAIKVFDINLRPPFMNRNLLEALLINADIVKFNQAELEMSQSLFGGSYYNEASQVAFIQEKFSIPEVIVTKGEFGAAYYKNQFVFNAWGTEVKVKDTIGSGDSFLAAFIATHLLKIEPAAMIKNAVAMGAFIATKKGGCPQYEISEYKDFKRQIF